MPRTKKKKIVKSSRVVKNLRKGRKSQPDSSATKWTSSYSSLLFGIVAVIIGVLFVVSFIKQSHVQQTSSLSTGPTPTVAVSPTPGATLSENGQTYYVVAPNDSLWSIAQSQYKDGYQWVKIAKANNLTNPGSIYTGDKLLLPDVAPTTSPLGQLENNTQGQTNPQAITQNTYTVQKGDTLWDVSVRAYADGYQWVKIAKANNLTNPDLIFSGNILTIPR